MTQRGPSEDIARVQLSDEERETGLLSPEHMYYAVDRFFKDGIVVLENAIPTVVLDSMNERMTKDTQQILSGKIGDIHWNQGAERGNIDQTPPLEDGCLYPEVYANKAAGAVLNNILGPFPELRFANSNALLPRTTRRQNVHHDMEGYQLHHPFAVALNACLIDTTPENGATELWLGTHLSARTTDYHEDSKTINLAWAVKDDALEARRRVRPPIYACLKKGSLVLRDLQLWHAGMPNHSDQLRIMLALVYTAKWFGSTAICPWPLSLKDEVERLGATNGTTITAYYPDNGTHYLSWPTKGDLGSHLGQANGVRRVES